MNGRNPGRWALGATAFYLALSLWQMRAVLRAPSQNAAFSNAFYEIGSRFGFHDLKMVVSQIAYNMRTIFSDPAALFVGPQCYPIELATTFGEHMLAEGLLGAIPFAISGDPLVALAAVLTVKPVIAALAVYFLVLRWTERPAAAFVAGLLFGFHPLRLIDPAHVFLSSHEWTPLALLALDAILAGGGWAWAALFVVATSLQMLESFYPLFGFTLLVGVFGIWKVVWRPHALARSLPKLAVCSVVLGILVWLVFSPYLQTRETWSVLADRDIYVLYPFAKYLPGDFLFLGFSFLGLGLVGLVDFLWRPDPNWRDDPRAPLLLGGILLAWFGIRDLEVPFLAWQIPALYHYLRWVPGVDAVRAPAIISYSGLIAAAVFAGYGVRVLLEARGFRLARVGVAALALLWVVEVFVPAVSTRVFGHRFDAAAVPLRPSEEVLALHEGLPERPILNLPWLRGKSGEYLLLAAYHQRRIGACYNSFEPPIAAYLRSVADRLPDPSALEAVAALGFGSLVIHDDVPMTPATRKRLAKFGEVVQGSEGQSRAVLTAEVPGYRAYVLESLHPPADDFDRLEGVPEPPLLLAPSSAGRLSFGFRNLSPRIYRHPRPIEPRPARVRWRTLAGDLVLEEAVRAMLPIVLVPHEQSSVEVRSPTPPVGVYDVTLSLEGEPERTLVTRRIEIVDAPGREAS